MSVNKQMLITYLQNEMDYIIDKIEELDSGDLAQEKIEQHLRTYRTVLDHSGMLKKLIEGGFFDTS
jgi:hypothetical protein